MTRSVLLIGAHAGLVGALERLVPGAAFRNVSSHSDTEGLDVDVVVVTGAHAAEELAGCRVHPNLHDRPLVLAVPGQRLESADWRALDVWPITTSGFAALDELAERVGVLLSRARHPASAEQPTSAGTVRRLYRAS